MCVSETKTGMKRPDPFLAARLVALLRKLPLLGTPMTFGRLQVPDAVFDETRARSDLPLSVPEMDRQDMQ